MATDTRIDWSDADAAGLALADNFRSFTACWLGDTPDEDGWTLQYTHNRDSDLLTESNAAAIEKALLDCDPETECYPCRHSHFACGWLEGFYIKTGSAAWAVYCELMARIDDYPVLDEDDFSERELEAAFENVKAALRYSREIELRDDLDLDAAAAEVHYWLDSHRSGDYAYSWPNDDDLYDACEALGLLADEDPDAA